MLKHLDDQTNIVLDERYRITATILFAQIFSVILLTIISVFIAGQFQPFGATTGNASFSTDSLSNFQANGGSATLTSFLWVTILALAISSFLLRRVILAPAALRDVALLKGASGLLKNLQTKTILLAAIGEVVAILGFVITLASGNYSDMIRAACVAIIVFFISFPRKSSWRNLAQAASG